MSPRMDAAFAPLAREDAVREGSPCLVEAIDAFLEDVGIRLAPLTRVTYERHLRPLRTREWPLTDIVCRSLIVDMVRAGKAPRTVNTFSGVLMAFVKFCREQGWLYADPMAHISTPKIVQKPHRYLSMDEIDRIRQACQDENERRIVAFLLTGLRAAELLSLRAEDIDGGLILVRGKGARYRYVALPDVPLPTSGPLFPYCYRSLLKYVQDLGKRAGIAHVHPHLFRHSWASHGVQHLDMITVQTVGGWSSDAMLRHYAASTIQRAAAEKARGLF